MLLVRVIAFLFRWQPETSDTRVELDPLEALETCGEVLEPNELLAAEIRHEQLRRVSETFWCHTHHELCGFCGCISPAVKALGIPKAGSAAASAPFSAAAEHINPN